jgi:hypothetical protein
MSRRNDCILFNLRTRPLESLRWSEIPRCENTVKVGFWDRTCPFSPNGFFIRSMRYNFLTTLQGGAAGRLGSTLAKLSDFVDAAWSVSTGPFVFDLGRRWIERPGHCKYLHRGCSDILIFTPQAVVVGGYGD